MQKKVLIVSHDAGGAQVVSAWVKLHPEYSYDFLLEGPAQSIFQEKLGNLKTKGLDECKSHLSAKKYDFVLTSTSWNSDLEKQIILSSLNQDIKVISFLDHWSEYLCRFTYENRLCLPDEIWVGDLHAEEIAKSNFPLANIKLIDNPYFKEIQNQYEKSTINFSKRKDQNQQNILFVCEPISELAQKIYHDKNYYKADEKDLLKKFFCTLVEQTKISYNVKVRYHPSESKHKYQDIMHSFAKQLDISISDNPSLIEECIWADQVVGFDSMALVIALLGQKKVYSCLPSSSNYRTLPYRDIEYIFADHVKPNLPLEVQ